MSLHLVDSRPNRRHTEDSLSRKPVRKLRRHPEKRVQVTGNTKHSEFNLFDMKFDGGSRYVTSEVTHHTMSQGLDEGWSAGAKVILESRYDELTVLRRRWFRDVLCDNVLQPNRVLVTQTLNTLNNGQRIGDIFLAVAFAD